MYRSVNVAYPYLFGLVVVVWFGAPARAAFALESCPDPRPLDAEHLMRSLLTALERATTVGWGLLGAVALGFWMVQSDRATPVLDLRPMRGGAIVFMKGSF